MDGIIIFLVFISVFGVVAFAVYYFSKKNRIIRALHKIPFRSVTNLRTNELSKLYGKALHVKAPLIAPYSNRECVFIK